MRARASPDRACAVSLHARGGVSPVQEPYDAAVRLYKQGDVAGAMAGLKEAVRLDPGYGQAHFSRCFVYHRWEENQAALNARSEGVRAAPDFPDSYYLCGVILRAPWPIATRPPDSTPNSGIQQEQSGPITRWRRCEAPGLRSRSEVQ